RPRACRAPRAARRAPRPRPGAGHPERRASPGRSRPATPRAGARAPARAGRRRAPGRRGASARRGARRPRPRRGAGQPRRARQAPHPGRAPRLVRPPSSLHRHAAPGYLGSGGALSSERAPARGDPARRRTGASRPRRECCARHVHFLDNDMAGCYHPSTRDHRVLTRRPMRWTCRLVGRRGGSCRPCEWCTLWQSAPGPLDSRRVRGVGRMPAELTPRRQWVLKSIVEEYVASATPVSSEHVARKATTPISTATLRNEMAALEELGLLRHPHTSAGRIPSDAGYRYYVECLMGPAELQAAERRTIYHQFHQVEFSIDEWLALARAVLARALQNAALATPPLASRPRVRRVELVPLQERTVLLVLMLQSGHIRQQMLPLEEPLDRE